MSRQLGLRREEATSCLTAAITPVGQRRDGVQESLTVVRRQAVDLSAGRPPTTQIILPTGLHTAVRPCFQVASQNTSSSQSGSSVRMKHLRDQEGPESCDDATAT